MIISEKDFCGIIGICKTCGSQVADYLCNNDLEKYRPESCDHDYWASCTNNDCENHYGEGYLQNKLVWVNRRKPF